MTMHDDGTLTPSSPPPTDGRAPGAPDRCLSDLALDRLVAAPEAAPPPHVATCARCAARLTLFREAAGRDEARAVAVMRRALDVPMPWWRRRLAPLVASAAVAAAALVVVPSVVLVEDAPKAARDVVRSKGLALRVFVRRDGAVREAAAATRFRAGDALRLEVATARPWLLVVGVGPSGVTAYFPFGGPASGRAPGGSGVLPGSLVLDDDPATEVLLAIASDRPLSLAEIEGALAARGLDSEHLRPAALAGIVPDAEVVAFPVVREALEPIE